MASLFRQCFFIPTPPLTEDNLPSQAGRVFIVTGGYAGVGKELCSILYAAGGTVYMAGRSADKAKAAIDELKSKHPSADGRLDFLELDLSDLPTIKPAVENFLKREQRLDVLTNNAGVMMPPVGSKAAQGHELQMGTNCLGPHLLTNLLTPLLARTAANSPAGSVRVTWAASLATALAPTNGVVIDSQNPTPKIHGNPQIDYAQSKAANVLLAREYHARHSAADGIVSCAWNPGNLTTELQRHMPWYQALFASWISYAPVYGAYTELFAGWGQGEGLDGGYVVPWGRVLDLRADVLKSPNQQAFWAYCEKETKPFM